MPKPVSFTRSKKLGDTFDPDIQPWKDDEQAGDKSAQELQSDLERKIQEWNLYLTLAGFVRFWVL